MTRLALEGGSKIRRKAWPKPVRRFGKEELRQLREALAQNTLFYIHGAKTRQLAARMGELVGRRHVLACSSGSAALHAAVKACGVGPGDEVITTPITDAGTILGIVYEGGIPVFADVDPTRYNLTAETVAARLTARTRAVIVVHLAGCPADVKGIIRLCRPKGIRVIEDCAQAWGARIGGRWVGTFGDIGCFSLNDYKHISAGDGGLIVTNDEELYRTAWLGIDKCYDRAGGGQNRLMTFCAPNYRITELQSAVALAQLEKVEDIAGRRHGLGERLSAGVRKVEGVIPHGILPGGYASYWFYLLQIDEGKLGVDARSFAAAMNAEGIPGYAGYVEPVYLAYPYLRNETALHHTRWPFSMRRGKSPYRAGYCPQAERVLKRCFNFPLKEYLTESDIDDVIAAVAKVAACYRSRTTAARQPARRGPRSKT